MLAQSPTPPREGRLSLSDQFCSDIAILTDISMRPPSQAEPPMTFCWPDPAKRPARLVNADAASAEVLTLVGGSGKPGEVAWRQPRASASGWSARHPSQLYDVDRRDGRATGSNPDM